MKRYLVVVFAAVSLLTFGAAVKTQFSLLSGTGNPALAGTPTIDADDAEAAAPVTEDLPVPTLSPAVITPGIATFITFTFEAPDATTRGPKLQFFDDARNHWKTVAALLNNGKLGDAVAGDLIFTLRVRFLDSSGTTEISLPPRQSGAPRPRGIASTPVRLRIVARRHGTPGLSSSPQLTLAAVSPTIVAVAGGAAGPQISVPVPATFDVIDASDSANVVLQKTGPDGYKVRVMIRSNPGTLTFEQWVLRNGYGFTSPEAPQTFSDFGEATVEPLTVAGLTGVKVTVNEPEGSGVSVFLDDPANGRVLWFDVYGLSLDQETNLTDNLAEALSIVLNLQR